MSELDSDRSSTLLDAVSVSDGLLDASSLNTVLAMLEVIDSVEELALLETLTFAQKRQVWDATPEATRMRLKQLRATAGQNTTSDREVHPDVALSASGQIFSTGTFNSSLNGAASTPLIDPADLPDLVQDDWLNQTEDTTTIDLEALEEIDLALHEPLNLAARSNIKVGDWVVLQAKPQLSRAELIAIWDVLEVRGDAARISAKALGVRNYPTAWMVVYPKPIEQEPEF